MMTPRIYYTLCVEPLLLIGGQYIQRKIPTEEAVSEDSSVASGKGPERRPWGKLSPRKYSVRIVGDRLLTACPG
jgi:hypothetical protein